MNLRKLPDWRTRLDEFIADVAAHPFDWRTHNCAGFVSRALAAQAGADPWEALRATFAECRTDHDVRHLLSVEYGGLEELFDAELLPHGFWRHPCATAGAPIITLGDDDQIGAGVSLGRYVCVLTTDGLIMTARHRILAAWSWP